jgi:hypothetical protein
MTIRQVLSLAASGAALVLTLVTLANMPTVVQAWGCWNQGTDVGINCRNQWGTGQGCAGCVDFWCNQVAEGQEAGCYEDCVAGGEYICFMTS